MMLTKEKKCIFFSMNEMSLWYNSPQSVHYKFSFQIFLPRENLFTNKYIKRGENVCQDICATDRFVILNVERLSDWESLLSNIYLQISDILKMFSDCFILKQGLFYSIILPTVKINFSKSLFLLKMF